MTTETLPVTCLTLAACAHRSACMHPTDNMDAAACMPAAAGTLPQPQRMTDPRLQQLDGAIERALRINKPIILTQPGLLLAAIQPGFNTGLDPKLLAGLHAVVLQPSMHIVPPTEVDVYTQYAQLLAGGGVGAGPGEGGVSLELFEHMAVSAGPSP